MADERFTWLHLPLSTSLEEAADDTDFWGVHLVEERFDESVWDLLPPYQDEEDESMLPSAAHPSYPYGNPYAPASSRSTQWHSAAPNPNHRVSHPPYRGGFPLPPLASSASVASRGFSSSLAGGGLSTGPRTSAWSDLALGQLLSSTRRGGGGFEDDDDDGIGEGGPTGQEQQQDAPQPPAADPAAAANGVAAGGGDVAAQGLAAEEAAFDAGTPSDEVDQNQSEEM